MVTIEQVNILVYRHHEAAELADDDLQLEISDDRPTLSAGSNSVVSISDSALGIIDAARKAAAGARRPFLDSVDVMLALLEESEGIAERALADLKIDLRTVERALRDEVSRDASSGEFLAALEARSGAEARWLEHPRVGTEHLLLAICEVRPSAATDVLMRLGAQPRDICKVVLQILGHQDDWQHWLADHPDM
jgi:ATP-dependent Clp protease ATP-binding subunit ClpA